MVITDTIVDLPGIGPVHFIRSRRARNIGISVRPFQGVRVAVPMGVSLRQAQTAVTTKTAWISKHLETAQSQEDQARQEPPIPVTEAKDLLRRRTDILSRQYGLPYNRVFIKRQKTRWGSCSIKNNINLNIRLYILPAELRDYVILHELVHTRHRNHGRQFWFLLTELCSDARHLNRRLRQYGLFSE
ncbi:MAG: SprT family zinc-dependent metalloprotease [Candidatus Neomarinimicrobiota bacterium]